MKKQYTRKQITEAIAYWEKQLRAGNCKKLNEAGSADKELLKKAGREALDDIEKNIEKYVKHDYGMDRVQPGSVARAFFDYIKAEPYGFSSKFKEHAHGIGNNSEWSIIKNGKEVGSFWCTDDMFGGVYAGVSVGGDDVD